MLDHAPNCAIKTYGVTWCSCQALNRWLTEQTKTPPQPITRQAKAA